MWSKKVDQELFVARDFKENVSIYIHTDLKVEGCFLNEVSS